jgi:iron(III) transport system substrate-binding protein
MDKSKFTCPGPSSLAGKLEKAFEKNRSDVLSILNSGGSSLAKRIWAEKKAGYIHVDVLLSSEPILFLSLKQENLLEQYISPETAAFKPDYLFGDGYFTPVNARYGVIVYSTANVAASEIPASFADLKKSHWQNRLAFADATQSSTALALNVGIYQSFDNSWGLQKAMKANNAMLLTRNSAVATKVKTGGDYC